MLKAIIKIMIITVIIIIIIIIIIITATLSVIIKSKLFYTYCALVKIGLFGFESLHIVTERLSKLNPGSTHYSLFEFVFYYYFYLFIFCFVFFFFV